MSTETRDPKTFDVASWLTDAKLPERSATVYQRADLIGLISDLERRIQNEVDVLGQEALDGNSKLVKEYRQLVGDFEESALTLFVRAVPEREQRAIADELGKDATKEEVGSATISRAIIGVQRKGGKREPVRFSPDEIIQFDAAVGPAQMQAVYNAWHLATREIPTVDADFLQKLSSRASGGA